MRENAILKTVDLRGNNIRADGLVVLAHALRSSPNVVSLGFKWNHVGSHVRGMQALCDVLKENTTVTSVDLRNNKIGSESGPVLGDMLQANHTLSHLDLSWNELGPDGGTALLNGLQSNHTLIDCQLSGNRIKEDTLHAIAFVLRRNRQNAPLSATAFAEGREAGPSNAPRPLPPPESPSRGLPAAGGILPPLGPAAAAMSATGMHAADTPTPGTGTLPPAPLPALPGVGGAAVPSEKARLVQDDGIALRLLQKEQNYSNAEDARFFGEVAEYIDLLQLDVARNKKYRLDAEERERVVTKGFMEREMRYAQEMRELENLLAKAKAEKDELLHDTQYLQHEIQRVKEEKAKTLQDKAKLEEVARATSDRLRCDIRDGMAITADLQTQIYKCKRNQQEHEEENARLRTFLGKCKDDLDRALR